MPAGALISVNNQGEFNNLLFGAASDYRLSKGEFVGARKRVLKRDATLDLMGDGSHLGVHRRAMFSKVWHFVIGPTTESTLETKLAAFETAWALNSDAEYHWKARGVHWKVNARPGDYDADETFSSNGILIVLAELIIPIPTPTVVT